MRDRRGPARHSHGGRVIQLDDGIGAALEQHLVQGNDLRPVGGLDARRFVVHGSDCGLQLVGARLMLDISQICGTDSPVSRHAARSQADR